MSAQNIELDNVPVPDDHFYPYEIDERIRTTSFTTYYLSRIGALFHPQTTEDFYSSDANAPDTFSSPKVSPLESLEQQPETMDPRTLLSTFDTFDRIIAEYYQQCLLDPSNEIPPRATSNRATFEQQKAASGYGSQSPNFKFFEDGASEGNNTETTNGEHHSRADSFSYTDAPSDTEITDILGSDQDNFDAQFSLLADIRKKDFREYGSGRLGSELDEASTQDAEMNDVEEEWHLPEEAFPGPIGQAVENESHQAVLQLEDTPMEDVQSADVIEPVPEQSVNNPTTAVTGREALPVVHAPVGLSPPNEAATLNLASNPWFWLVVAYYRASRVLIEDDATAETRERLDAAKSELEALRKQSCQDGVFECLFCPCKTKIDSSTRNRHEHEEHTGLRFACNNFPACNATEAITAQKFKRPERMLPHIKVCRDMPGLGKNHQNYYTRVVVPSSINLRCRMGFTTAQFCEALTGCGLRLVTLEVLRNAAQVGV